jgi:hypothetical protein
MDNNRYLLVGIVILLCVSPLVSAQSPVCGSQTLYFQHQNSPDIPGYEELMNYPSGNAQVDETITIKNTDGPVLIDSYIMPAGSLASATVLTKGLRTFTTFHYVDGASGTTQINFTAFQRFQNGTEIVFYSQLTEDIDSLTPIAYTTYRVSQQDLQLAPTDRLGIKVYGQTTHSAPVILHFVYQGTTNTSHFQSGFFECPGITTKSVTVYSMNRVPLPISLPIFAILSCIAIFAMRRYR